MSSNKRGVMKRIIGRLKKKCCSEEELRTLLKKEVITLSHGAIRKRVSRYLNELVESGLVEKRGEKYCWYIYINDFNDRTDYNAKLLHSRKLIPAFKQIAGITWPKYVMSPPEELVSADDMRILVQCVEDHLRAYPEIWKLLEDYRGMIGKAEQGKKIFSANLMEKLMREFEKEHIADPKRVSIEASWETTCLC